MERGHHRRVPIFSGSLIKYYCTQEWLEYSVDDVCEVAFGHIKWRRNCPVYLLNGTASSWHFLYVLPSFFQIGYCSKFSSFPPIFSYDCSSLINFYRQSLPCMWPIQLPFRIFLWILLSSLTLSKDFHSWSYLSTLFFLYFVTFRSFQELFFLLTKFLYMHYSAYYKIIPLL